MEDSITESELKTGVEDYQQDEAHRGDLGNGEVKKGGESNESKMDVEEEGHDKRNGGLINHIISNLVSPSSPKSRESVEVEKTEVKDEDGEDQVEVGGGIINNLISNFFHHGEGEGEVKDKMNIEVDHVHEGNKHVHKDGEEKGEMEMSGGGIINNLISNFFHQNEGEGGGGGVKEEKSSEERKGVVGIKGNEQVKVEEEEGGGGIINNIVSNLPASLQENHVPASDEASILIHSIIHD